MLKATIISKLDELRSSFRAVKGELVLVDSPEVAQLEGLLELIKNGPKVVREQTVVVKWDSEGNMILPEELQQLQAQGTERATPTAPPEPTAGSGVQEEPAPTGEMRATALPREPRIPPRIEIEQTDKDGVELPGKVISFD